MLSFAQPSFTVVKQGQDKHLLVSVCIHGNETCGLLAFHELLQANQYAAAKYPCLHVCI